MLQEELETNKSMKESTSDNAKLKKMCKQFMNKATSLHLIPKAEATVLLEKLDLLTCFEYIETISISNSRKLTLKITP